MHPGTLIPIVPRDLELVDDFLDRYRKVKARPLNASADEEKNKDNQRGGKLCEIVVARASGGVVDLGVYLGRDSGSDILMPGGIRCSAKGVMVDTAWGLKNKGFMLFRNPGDGRDDPHITLLALLAPSRTEVLVAGWLPMEEYDALAKTFVPKDPDKVRNFIKKGGSKFVLRSQLRPARELTDWWW